MAQVSYGTITITDTNDIERIYMEYAQSSSPSTAPTTGWSENIPAWEQGKYIWQRTVVKKEGVALSSDSYGEPVCLTGSTGSTGSTGRGVSSIVTSYCNYGTGTPAANYSGWGSTVPTYDSTKPNYWIKTVITYTSGTPSTDTKIYQDNGITSATATAASANTTAQTANTTANQANTNASNALSIANAANTTATGINQHFWWLESDTATTGGTLAAGSYITDILANTFKANPQTYGNLLLRSDGVYLKLGLTTLASFKSNALTFYNSAGTELGTFGSTGLSMSGTLDIRGGGRIGQDSSNYWKFGDNRSYKDTDSAYLIGYGNASIQLGETGHWRLDRNRIHSGWYQLDDTTQGLLHFDTGTDGNSTYYWDYGINYPNKSGNGTNKFLYVRRSNATTSTTLATMKGRVDDDSYWTYKFYVDGDGNVHAPGFYVGDSTTPIGGGANTIAQKIINSDGTTYGKGSTTQPIYIDSSGYVQTIGYTIQTSVPANAVFTDTLNTAGSTDTSSKLFLIGATTQAANPQTYSNSGTYAQSDKLYSNSKEVVNLSDSQALTNKTYNGYTLAAASAKGVDTSVTASSTSTNLPTSAAVANLVSQYLPLTGGNITGEVSFGDSVTADELTVGDLVVNGAASFTNNLQANTINGVVVGSSPKFTDTVTTVTITGSGNAITSASASNGAVTLTKGTTFPTGSGTNGYLTKWTGTNTIGNGPQLGSATNTFLRNDGTWATPAGTYSLSVATYNTLGGVKPAYSTTGSVSLTTAAAANTTTPTIAAKSTTSGRYYAVEIDKNGVLFVNVPWTNVNSSYLTSITSNDVTTALGYTPYDAANPNGYASGTVTSVKVQGSNGLTGSGTITTSGTITISHDDTSSQASSSNNGRTYIQSITLDGYGHVTGLSTATETVTDTHHTAYIYATTSTGTANTTTAQTDPYLTLVENGSARSRVQLKAGTNVTSISANAGIITFNVKDTTYTAATAAPGKVAASSSQGTSTNYARQDHTHGIDLATGDSNGQVKIAGTNVSVKGLGSWAYKSSGTASDVGLSNVTNYSQITKIGESGDGKLRVWTGDPDGTGYTDVEVHITAYDQSTVSKAEALNLSAKVGDTNKPVYFKADGKPYAISYEINKSVPSDALFTDHTYEFADTYNASTNKGATVATVTNAINALDGGTIGTPGTGKTLTALSETNGNISATFGDISITASQISDLSNAVSGMTAEPASHTHGNITNGGDITATAPTIASGDQIIINDNSASKITNGPTFDGSTTSKALTPKGTWETFLQSHQTYNSFTGKPTGNQTPGFGSSFTISQISQSTTGQVSGTDRTVTIPATIATYNAVGLIKPWFSTTGASTLPSGSSAAAFSNTPAVSARTTTAGRYYAIEIDKNGRLFVNVPWENTTYTIPTVTQSNTTGITIANHSTTSITGVSGSTTASKVTIGSHATDYGVKTSGSFTQGTDSFTAASYGTDSFTAASLSNGFYTVGTAASFTRGTFSQGTLPTLTMSVSGTELTITFGQGTLPTHAADSFTANVPTKIDTTKFNGGSYSHSGFSGGSFTQGTDSYTAPTLGSKIPTVSASDITVPKAATSSTTVVTSATHSITDNGHSHAI